MELRRKSSRLEGRRIAHCVTGSVAAVEAPRLARELQRHGALVHAYMSRDAAGIIHPNIMEFATGERVVTELTGKMEHLRGYDLVLIAPATATTIGKIAHGIADSAVTALSLATKAKILIAPAMGLGMYESQAMRANVELLKERGCSFVEPKIEEGKAKLAAMEEVVDACIHALSEKDLSGKRVIVTAGPTIEYIDPVRIISNKSSGRMGLEMAREAYFRGARVELVYGRGFVEPPRYLNVSRVETAAEMLSQVRKGARDGCDFFIAAAAVSDFAPMKRSEKIESSKGTLKLELYPTPKVLDEMRGKAVRMGFKAIYNASRKELEAAAKRALTEYGVEIAVSNDAGKAMGSPENEVCIATRDGLKYVPSMPKADVAKIIWDIAAKTKRKR